MSEKNVTHLAAADKFDVGSIVVLQRDAVAIDLSIIPAGTRVKIIDNHKNRRTSIAQADGSEPLLDDICYKFEAIVEEIVETWLPVAVDPIETRFLRGDLALCETVTPAPGVMCYLARGMQCTTRDAKLGLRTRHNLVRGAKILITAGPISVQTGGMYYFRPAQVKRGQVVKSGRHRLEHSAFEVAPVVSV